MLLFFSFLLDCICYIQVTWIWLSVIYLLHEFIYVYTHTYIIHFKITFSISDIHFSQLDIVSDFQWHWLAVHSPVALDRLRPVRFLKLVSQWSLIPNESIILFLCFGERDCLVIWGHKVLPNFIIWFVKTFYPSFTWIYMTQSFLLITQSFSLHQQKSNWFFWGASVVQLL